MKELFSEEQQKVLVEAIAAAEANTSGEIMLHIERACKGDPVARAWKIFARLKMHKTKLRNGVLIYLATESHQFAVIGDEGIHKRVGNSFWELNRDEALRAFKEGRFTEGLISVLNHIGEQLHRYFPTEGDNPNELKNDISFGI